MTEELPGDQVGRRVTVQFRTTSDIYAARWRIINKMIADELCALLDGEVGMDPPVGDGGGQLRLVESAQSEQRLPRPRELGEGFGGQLSVRQVHRPEAIRRVVAKWAPFLDPSHPAVAAYLTSLVQQFPELQAALVDNGIDLPLDFGEP